MAEALVFALNASLGAMGGIAVGERRSGWERPARSAVLGLVAACLGLDRADEAAHQELDGAHGLAIRRDRPASALVADYHTAQVPPQRRGVRHATRAEELAAPKLETILSRRDYRVDLAFTVVLWQRRAGRWSLRDLAQALRAPRFVPYFGRKSCPLTLPMRPEVLAADSVVDALARYDHGAPSLVAARRAGRAAVDRPIWADRATGQELPLGATVQRIESRRDAVASRSRWQFELRDELVADWTGGSSPSERT